MKLRDFICQLDNIKDELKDKDVVIEAPNGLQLDPSFKFITIYPSMELSKENVDKIIITYND